MSNEYTMGQCAARAGQPRAANPYTAGTTKLGNPRLTEEGIEWDNGWLSAQPARVCSPAEMQAAATVDVSRFRRKSNRHYSS